MVEFGWGYGSELPPERWSVRFPAALGTGQSPIAVDSQIDQENKIPKSENLRPDYDKAVSEVHVLFKDLHVEYEPSGGCFGNLAVGRVTAELKQFHLHTPSEHTVDGKSYAMELHFVHEEPTSKDKHVLAVMVEEVRAGASSPFLMTLADAEPFRPHPISPSLDLNRVFPGPLERSAYYRYEGSLTTPPCTEGVVFYLLEDSLVAATDVLTKFRRFAPGGNNRSLQGRNGRTVSYFDPRASAKRTASKGGKRSAPGRPGGRA